MRSVLVIAAHPDDEVLGCGGTIARHISRGDQVHSVFMSDGVNARPHSSEINLQKRKEASKLASDSLGITSSYFLDFPDNRMDSVSMLEIVKKIEPIIDKIKPSIVYTHHHSDLNIDHQLTNSATMIACRPLPNSTVKEIYGFEVLSSTEWSNFQKETFNPKFFVDITDYMTKKINALKEYKDELRDPPHSRSIQHVEVLAKHRGYSIGVNMAEAFEIYRIIN